MLQDSGSWCLEELEYCSVLHTFSNVFYSFSTRSSPIIATYDIVHYNFIAFVQINSLNATALKMYGYANRDIVGRNISTLIPEPFASVHNK